ncbi:MAG TPA: hypothetical protein VGO40_01535 [Longimicrobium sp.]|jgi:CubicO group peptidase (beta-lactamase class C family)|nr:hypothetical protein [Longimicrobium sp.]
MRTIRHSRVFPVFPALLLLAAPAGAQRGAYVPAPGEAWEHRSPARVGIDSARLQEAVAFHRAHESRAPRDLVQAHYQTFGREPFGEPVGPFKPRGEPAGIVVRRGYLVAEWGDPRRVDMTFSVTKSFLSTVIGVAYDRRMIRSLDDPVAAYMAPVFRSTPRPRRAPRRSGWRAPRCWSPSTRRTTAASPGTTCCAR